MPPDPNGSLHARPTLPQMVATYQHLLDELHTALIPVVGSQGWGTRTDSAAPRALCQDFGNRLDTGIETLPTMTFDHEMSTDQWERAKGVIADVVGRYGFNRPGVVVERPDEHRLGSRDTFGGDLTVQAGPRFIDIMLTTGCHLLPPPRQP